VRRIFVAGDSTARKRDMRHTRVLAPVLVGALLASVLVTSGTAAAQKKGKKKSGPKVVGTDPADDWGCNQDCELQPIGDAMGQELVKAEIGLADKKTLNFIITVNSLPPTGGMPEFTRYVWQMLVDDEFVELDGKWSNYSRGICDPTSGQCPPPRDPGCSRSSCAATARSSGASSRARSSAWSAEFDPGAATITIPVPLEMLGAKKGSRIVGAQQSDTGFSGITAIPSAFYSQTTMPYDMLALTGVFTVPKK
jgi:hypothetical protein